MEAGRGEKMGKAGEVLGGRSRENKAAQMVDSSGPPNLGAPPLVPRIKVHPSGPLNLDAFRAKKVTDPGIDFVYFQ